MFRNSRFFVKTFKVAITSNIFISRYMELAAQAKVVMEMPEKIWSQVEGGCMISAALLYLQVTP